MNRKECYEILELPIGAGGEEVKKSYRKMAMKWHPDRNSSPEAQEKMSKINMAYETLTTQPPNILDGLFGFDFFGRPMWNAKSTSSITINLEDTADAKKVIEAIKSYGIKIKGYSIETRTH